MDRLRAKSWDPDDGIPPKSVFLPNHLADVVLCADAIIEATGVYQLNAFGIDSSRHVSRFRKLTLLAAACHDLGKANSQFQSLVQGQRDSTKRQAVRHEWVSWYILQHTPVREWLFSHLDDSTREIDWQILLWSITGHHPAFGRDIRTTSPSGSTDTMELYLGHDDFHAAFDVLANSTHQQTLTVSRRRRTLYKRLGARVLLRLTVKRAQSIVDHQHAGGSVQYGFHHSSTCFESSFNFSTSLLARLVLSLGSSTIR